MLTNTFGSLFNKVAQKQSGLTRREVSPWPPGSKSPSLKCVRPADQWKCHELNKSGAAAALAGCIENQGASSPARARARLCGYLAGARALSIDTAIVYSHLEAAANFRSRLSGLHLLRATSAPVVATQREQKIEKRRFGWRNFWY